jgi:hypothetical protein
VLEFAARGSTSIGMACVVASPARTANVRKLRLNMFDEEY